MEGAGEETVNTVRTYLNNKPFVLQGFYVPLVNKKNNILINEQTGKEKKEFIPVDFSIYDRHRTPE